MSNDQIEASIRWRGEVKKLIAKHNKGYHSGNRRTEPSPELPPKPEILQGDQRRSVTFSQKYDRNVA